jgi:plasmid stabilization system protein ParE
MWLDGLIKAVESLAEFPKRCAIAPENSLAKKDKKTIIRHFIYKKTFRIIFTAAKGEVRILSIKHSARFSF